jgi:gamma-glutamylcyclotransferase
MKTNQLYYFAYGSNLYPERLRRRVPSSRAIATTALRGYRLEFHKRSEDGSGKCNAFYTGHSNDHVLGVVYRMEVAERWLLDRAEGLSRGYHSRLERVMFDGREHEVFFYVADSAYIDASLAPYNWYKALVLSGAKIHGFPQPYLTVLQAVPEIEDHDEARALDHFAIIAESG